MPADQADKLINLFLRKPTDGIIKPIDVSLACSIPLAKAVSILRALVSDEVVEKLPFQCNACDASLDVLPENGLCPYCKQDVEVDQHFAVGYPGVLTEADEETLSRSAAVKRKARRLVDAWDRQGHVFYLILDMVRSQAIQQHLGDVDYNIFLNRMREIMRLKVYSQLRGAVLSFGEIGDMHKMVFEKFDDVLKTLQLVSKNLPPRGDFPKVPTDIPFPCYSGRVLRMNTHHDTNGKPIPAGDIVTLTMNGTPDLNMGKLTEYYRLDGKISTDIGVYSDQVNMTIWFFRKTEIAFPKKIPDSAWHHFKYRTHASEGEDDAFMAYFGNGLLIGAEPEPSKILIEK